MTPDHPLSVGGTTYALLDANALLPPRLSDVLFDLYGAGLFSAKWTESIEQEFLRNWPNVINKARRKASKKAPLLTPQQVATAQASASRRLSCYQGAVFDYEVYGHDEPSVLAQVHGKHGRKSKDKEEMGYFFHAFRGQRCNLRKSLFSFFGAICGSPPIISLGCNPSFLAMASLATCPAAGCWDCIPAYSFFVIFVFFVDHAFALDVFRGHHPQCCKIRNPLI